MVFSVENYRPKLDIDKLFGTSPKYCIMLKIGYVDKLYIFPWTNQNLSTLPCALKHLIFTAIKYFESCKAFLRRLRAVFLP